MGESFRKIEQIQQIRIGVDYYPEHWPCEMWEKDADRMKESVDLSRFVIMQ